MPWSEVVFVGAFATYVAIRAHFERRVGATPTEAAPHARMERALLGVMTIGAIGLPVGYLATPWLSDWDYRLSTGVNVVGTLTSLVALWLFWRAHVDLGASWSRTMALRRDHRLVTHGVYRHVRHPMYSAIWLFGLGQACLLHNAVAGWSALVAFAPMYGFRVAREERMMRKRFGQAYEDYCSTSGRLWPRARRTT